jgi:hypothetical protein
MRLLERGLRRPVLVVVSLLLLGTLGCGGGASDSAPKPEDDGPGYFEDVTGPSGVDFTYRNGQEAGHYAILESLGGGVALIDFDGDGLLDVFLTGGGCFGGADKKNIQGLPCKLYRNLGGFRFQDVTAAAGLDGLAGGKPWFYTHGAAVADYDRDGWPDLLVTGWGRVALFHNESDGKGGRRFRDVTREAGLTREHIWATSAAWGDLDGDGWPDLYVCQYVDWSWDHNPVCAGYTTNVPRDVCPPGQFNSAPHALYHNVPGPNGRRFVDAGRAAGIRAAPRKDEDYGKGLGVLLVDLDGDGRPDIYVANDTSGNFLFLNRSAPGRLKFDDVGFALGVSRDGSGTPTGSMGVDAGDYNATGLPSVWVTNYEGELHSLYRNKRGGGSLFFQYSTQPAGIAVIGQNFVGFGTGFVDVDGDGREDLVICNGHVIRHPYRCGVKQAPVLFRNQGRGTFADVTRRGGAYFRTEHCGRGLAVGDLDNDGRRDLVISHLNEPVAVLRNQAGQGQHWLGLELAGQDRADVVGARVILEAGDRRWTRFAKGGGSYLSSGDRRQLIGLGDTAAVGRLTVEWPAGQPRVQHWDGLRVDAYYRLVQGQASATELYVRAENR